MEILYEKSHYEMCFYRTKWKKGDKPFHWHERIELVIPKTAPIAALIDGVWYEAKPGDLLMIGEGRIHAFRVESEESEILLGQFPYRILLSGGTVPPALPPLILHEEIAADARLSSCLDAILEVLLHEGRVKNEEKNPLMQSMCLALYYLLARHFEAPEEGKTAKKEKGEFSRIVSYVNEHFTEPITVGSVARSLYLDRGKLSRLFHTYGGMSLGTYINTLRIDRATHLIKEGSAITEAALEAGFQSVRTFHEVYRRMRGASPRELKR